MPQYEAVFEMDSKADSYAVERILTQTYDTIREESRTIGDNAGDASALLRTFQALRDAATTPTTGRLTIVLEQDDDDG